MTDNRWPDTPGIAAAIKRLDADPAIRDAGKRMAAATPVPPPSPAIYVSESHKDRTAAEEFRR